MLKCALLLLLSTVAHTSARTCCLPDKFETIVGDIEGYATAGKTGTSLGAIALSFDFADKKIAVYINMTTEGVSFQQKLIEDYIKNVTYTIDEKAKTCKKTSPPLPLQHCVPPGSEFLGHFYFGSGSNMLQAQAYAINDPTHQVRRIVSSTMDCVPITEVAYGVQSGVNFMTTMGWTQTTIGIKDPSVFTPPSYCQQAEEVESASNPLVRTFLHAKKPGFN